MAERLNLGTNGITFSELCFEDDLVVTREVMPARHVQTILDSTQRLRSEHLPEKRLGSMAARVPVTLRNEWRKEWRKTRGDHGMRWGDYLVMKINSTDFAKLRAQDKRL